MNNIQVLTENKKKHNYIPLLLLLGLLLLRFPFLILLLFDKIPISKAIGSNMFQDGTYLLTATLIFVKRDSLSKYNIDFLSLLIFMIAPVAKIMSQFFLATKYSYKNMISADWWLQIVISICLLVALLLYRPALQKRKIKEMLLWFLIAVLVGIGSGVLMGYITSLQGNGNSGMHPTISLLISLFFIQLGNAAVIEEPLFRGFLWGFLKNQHWNEYLIWLFQAVLFTLAHIYYFGANNFSFFVVVPFSALMFGLCAWRSRSIGTSMIVHGFYNSVTDAVSHMAWQ